MNHSNTDHNHSRHQQTTLFNNTANMQTIDEMEISSTTNTTLNLRPITRSLAKLQHQHLIDTNKTQQKPLQATYQRILTNEKPCNIINILDNSRLKANMPRIIGNVSSSYK